MNYMNEQMRDTGPGERPATETKLGCFSMFCVISVLHLYLDIQYEYL